MAVRTFALTATFVTLDGQARPSVPIAIGLAEATRAETTPYEFVAAIHLTADTNASGAVSFDLIPSADLQGSPDYIVYDHDTEVGRFQMPAEAAVLGALEFSPS